MRYGWLLLVVAGAVGAACGGVESVPDVVKDGSTAEMPVADAVSPEVEFADLMREDAHEAELPDAMDMELPDPRLALFEVLASVIEQERLDMDIPGLAVAVMLDGELAWSRGFGTKDPAGGAPVLATTLFRFGSIAKMMTSTAILQQEEAGCLLTSEALVQHAPDFTLVKTPEGVPEITLSHLMTHSSGLSDFLVIDVPAAQKEDGALAEYALGLMPYNLWLNAPAGRLFNYSNPNYILAGLVAELCAGKNYRDYMKSSVFEPLGMARTTFRPAEVLADGDYALGRSYDPLEEMELVIEPDSYDNAWGAPAGYGFSSVEDLALFAKFLLEGNPVVLTDERVAELSTKRVDTQMVADQLWYGYGVMVSTSYLLPDGLHEVATPVWHHGGAINGFSAMMTLLPEFGFGFITLASTDGAYPAISPHKAVELLLDLPEPVPATDISDDATLYGDYVGEFLDPFNIGRMGLSVQDGKLHLQMADLDEAGYPYEPLLEPVSLRNYLLWVDGYPLQLTILLDDAGKAEYLRTRIAVGKRVEPEDPPQRLTVDVSRLPWLLGRPHPQLVPWFLAR